MSAWLSAWLSAFVLTQVVEMPIYLRALLAREQGEPVLSSWPAAVGVAFGASALTHPIVWFVMPELIPGNRNYVLMVAVAELFAIVAEAAWLRAFGLRRALIWAMFANAASVVVGMLLRRIFGWP